MIKLSISYIQFWELVVASLGLVCSFVTIVWWIFRDFKRRIKIEIEVVIDKMGDDLKSVMYDMQEDIAGNTTEINHINNGLEDNTHWYQRLPVSRPKYLK